MVNIAGQAGGTEAMDERVVNSLEGDATTSASIQAGSYTLDQALAALGNFTLCVNKASGLVVEIEKTETLSPTIKTHTLRKLRTSLISSQKLGPIVFLLGGM